MVPADVEQIAAELEAEQAALDDLVAPLDAAAWETATPAEGWNVADTIAHLAVAEDMAVMAVHEPDRFQATLERALTDPGAAEEIASGVGRYANTDELLAWWRTSRQATIDSVRALPDGARIVWFGPPMGARSFLTARLMETWAHGEDVRETLGVPPLATDRLRNIAHIGVATRGFAYVNRGLDPPDWDVRIELTGPDGDLWAWGPEDAADRVTGAAADFCLTVTQRRNVADTALVVEGDHAREWMAIAQCFAGPPTDPRPPRLGGSRPLRFGVA
jgi:uncharacterized protein (TIGR03084 family)